ncbi:MAG: ribulose-phosphate 3-epimerase [Alphaproteobacteria bacterium]|nr:ribulose-phosphate 3-epimerase [Alphaproteobacteria bacterium]
MVKIAPSLLSADFANLQREVEKLEQSGADMLHLDIMDGHYVPNLTFGSTVVKSLRPYSKLPFDVHLMVRNPDEMIPWFIASGADIITVHAETCPHLDKTLQTIRSYGLKAGVALNPSTPETILEYVLDKVDMILVMSVNPGFGGQKFIDSAINKISKIKNMIGDKNIEIEVDGGINPLTAARCISAGADILVAGTAVFSGGDYARNIDSLR